MSTKQILLPGTKPRDYFSKTSLGHLLTSPQAFLDYLNGNKDKGGSGLEFGRLHDLFCFSGKTIEQARASLDIFDDVSLLEGELASNKSPKATKIWKEAIAEFHAGLLPGAEPALRSDVDKATAMAIVYNNHPLKAFHGEGARYQVDRTGAVGDYLVRAICDVETSLMVIEGKSTADHDRFYYDAKDFNYDLQAYLLRSLFGKDVVFHVQCTKEPYEVREWTCSERWYELGEKKYERAVKRYEDYIMGGDEKAIRNFYVSSEL